MIRRPPRSTLFPYTRSSDLTTKGGYRMEYQHVLFPKVSKHTRHVILHMFRQMERQSEWERDRKSTRLNSSHQIISYAVFCLKKKKTIAYCNRYPRSRVQVNL